MADWQSPIQVAPPNLPLAPVEETPQSYLSGRAQQIGKQFSYGNLGAEWVSKGIGTTYGAGDPRNVHVSHDDAALYFKNQNMDPAAIPKDGWTVGAMAVEFNRQEQLQRSQMQAKRAGVGTWGGIADNFLGGAGDPINMALGPVAGKVFGGIRAGLAGRAALGAAEGGVFVGGYVAGQKATEGHAADIISWDTGRDVAIGALTGGALHSAFGARPIAPLSDAELEPYRRMIHIGEGTADFSAKSGVPVNEVVSKPAPSGGRGGAVGLNQVEPDAAWSAGFFHDLPNPVRGTKEWDEITERLKDGKTNQQVADTILRGLHKQFPGDPEAIAVGWNGGKGLAKRFVDAGHDRSILPEQTRQFLNRIAKNGGRDVFGQRPQATDISGYTEPTQQSLPFQGEFGLTKPEPEQGELALRPAREELGPDVHESGKQEELEFEDPILRGIKIWTSQLGRPHGGEQLDMDLQGAVPGDAQRAIPELYQQALKLAATQMQNDSPVAVPKIEDAIAEWKAAGQPAQPGSKVRVGPMNALLPKSGAIYRGAKIPAETPNLATGATPKTAEAQHHLTETEKAAKATVQHMGPEAEAAYESALSENIREPEEGTLQHDEMTKGAEAATNCMISKGLS